MIFYFIEIEVPLVHHKAPNNNNNNNYYSQIIHQQQKLLRFQKNNIVLLDQLVQSLFVDVVFLFENIN